MYDLAAESDTSRGELNENLMAPALKKLLASIAWQQKSTTDRAQLASMARHMLALLRSPWPMMKFMIRIKDKQTKYSKHKSLDLYIKAVRFIVTPWIWRPGSPRIPRVPLLKLSEPPRR